ncbi:Manganese peroxidase 2 OS=Phlebia radiata GN=mnp2 PE=1 SV=1 [Rhizoctonia solani AG-1 IB]|uniref:Peroxidase n=1 Tax=Thanatephorus cucumeris (strain AG1-IB / isolate 7/3/14) TaxID=1108050 RepID=A0A0B7FA01_THACB|nr:Manganese peroxidase 2 OS=Phlebia radiata GN=mnp2 PE=1 SV=1 [Rhizoctonia solani AG-1 IB]
MLPRLVLLSLAVKLAAADWTWPNPVLDEIEDITQVQGGVFRNGVLDGVSPCGAFPQSGTGDPSRQASSEWLRTAFHDAITHNAEAGTGGVDASLIWETDRSENLGGRSFNDTFGFMLNFYNIRASMSDLIALATYTAVRTCRGPPLVMRAGRIDATEPGPEGGVPEPKDNINKLLSKFANAGFNKTDMIQMVACGHRGIGSGFEAVFWFYEIPSVILPNGISHFNVSLTNTTTGAETTYDNNGHGYPVQDNVIFQAAQSCHIFDPNANGNLTLTAAVRDGLNLTNPSLNVVLKNPRANSVVPALTVETAPMKLLRSTEFGYTLYSGSYSLPINSWSTTADVWVEGPDGVKYEDGFKRTSAFNEECGTF